MFASIYDVCMLPEVRVVTRRFWAPLGHGHALDDNGFLSDPESTFSGVRWTNLAAVTDAELRDCRCLVLLGEPGMGKSTFLAQVSPLLPEDCVAEVVEFDLAGFGSEDRLVRSVFESAQVERWREGCGELCLILDGFDDAQTRIPQLGALIAGELRRWPVERLWLRIACRTSDWPDSLAAVLRGLMPSTTAVELLPLRRSDIAMVAAERVADPERFLAAVEVRGVGALAARPLTLTFLLGAFAKDDRLPERAGDLYRKSLLAMCDEQNPSRRVASPRTASPADIYAAARRVAAVSVFGGVTAVWLGPLPYPADEDLIAVDELTGGTEPGFGDEVSITPSIVRETLRTPLFSGRGESRLGWAHTTFQDFLAADWLLANDLAEHQVRALLLADDGGVRPQVRRVAAWAVALSSALRWLADVDPESFAGEVDIPDPDIREMLVGQLLAAAATERLLDRYSTRYSGLGHPRLADQLEPVLAEPGPARWLAVRLAADCEVGDCDPALVMIALDPAASMYERVAAGWALYRHGSAGGSLLPLVHDETLRREDRHHELLGIGLLASWPHALTTAQALEVLAEARGRNRGGTYGEFIDDLVRGLTFDDLPAAASWLWKTKDAADGDVLGRVRNACLKLCVNHLDDPDAAAAAIAVTKIQLVEHDRVLADNESLTVGARRKLALLVAQAADADTDADLLALLVCGSGALLTTDDFFWLLDLAAAANADDQATIHRLLAHLVDPTRSDHANAVLSLDPASPLRPVFAYWLGTCDLTDPAVVEVWTAWQRRRERRARQENSEDDFDDQIATHLDRFENGEPTGYWIATRLVCIRPGTKYYDDEFQPDLTTHPRWGRLPLSVRNRFVELAPRYLAEGRCAPERWLGKELNYHPAEAGYRALLLLHRHDRATLEALPASIWREWAPIIIAWATSSNGAQERDKEILIRYAIPHARQELHTTLLAVIDETIRTGRPHYTRTEADLLWDDQLRHALTNRLAGPLPNEVRAELASTFLRNEPATAHALLVTWLDQDPELSTTAAALLLHHRASQAWPAIRDWLHTHPHDAETMILRYADNRTLPLELPTDALTELYLWLWDHFPPNEDPHDDDTHTVLPRESVGNFRDRILEQLRQAGTKDALTAIRRIIDAHPEATWLNRVDVAAREAHRQKTWCLTSLTQLRQLAENNRTRLVRTEKELLDATIAALDVIQRRLIGETPESHLLWDTKARQPKAEDEISDYLKNRLTDELNHRRVVINREAQVRRNTPTGIGERADLRIDCFDEDDELITAVIEVKYAWNKEVTTALTDQLVGQYMRDIGTTAGVFLVLWTNREPGTAQTSTQTKSNHTSKPQLAELLRQQANEQSDRGRDIRIVHLDISYLRVDEQSSGN